MAPSWALMGSVCSRSQLNPRAAINSFQQLQRGAEGTRLSGGYGRGSCKRGTTLCIPSRQLGWLEMALAPGDRCHFLLITGGSAQPAQPHTDTFSSSGGQGGCHPKVTLRDIEDSSPPALAVRAAPGKFVGLCRIRTSGREQPCPTWSFPPLPFPCAPAQALSRWK